MIHVIATIELFPGQRDDYLKKLHEVVPQVRREPGCRGYVPAEDFLTDIPIQDPPEDNKVTIIEAWEDSDALKTHLAAAHMKTFFAAVANFVKETRLRVLTTL